VLNQACVDYALPDLSRLGYLESRCKPHLHNELDCHKRIDLGCVGPREISTITTRSVSKE
jgi:hypothetical protein